MLKSAFIGLLLVACAEALECYHDVMFSHDEAKRNKTIVKASPGMVCVRYDRVLNKTSELTDFSDLLTVIECACDDITSTCAHDADDDPDIISCEAKCCNTDLCNGAKLSDIVAYPPRPDVTTEVPSTPAPDVPFQCYWGSQDGHDPVADDHSLWNNTSPYKTVCYRLDKAVVNGTQDPYGETLFGSIQSCVCDNPEDICSYHDYAYNETDINILSCEAKCCNTDLCNGAKLSEIEAYPPGPDVISSTTTDSRAETTNSDVTIISTTTYLPSTQSASSGDNQIKTTTPTSPDTTSSVGTIFNKQTSFFMTLAPTLACLVSQHR